jgi:hypothetical protein
VRRALTWLLLLPLVLLGSEAAHSLDFWLVSHDDGERAELLAETGHGYLELVPVAIAICGAVVVLALLGWALESRRGRRAPRLPFAPFALLPPIAFAVRELVERAAYHDDLHLEVFAEPVLLVGLAVQLPFSLLAFLVGRSLLRAAETLGVSLSGEAERSLLSPLPLPAPHFELSLPRLSPLALSHAVRGPPARR